MKIKENHCAFVRMNHVNTTGLAYLKHCREALVASDTSSYVSESRLSHTRMQYNM